MKLTNIQCKNAKHNPEGLGNKLADGGGLVLHVQEKGKYWRFNYRFLGKQKTLALGTLENTSLKEARSKLDDAKKLLAEGKDPGEQKKLAKIELRQNYDNNFEAIAREWHQQKRHTWKPDHAENIMKRLETNVFPHIGKRPVKNITAPEVLAALRIMEKKGNRDLAHRMKQHCSQIFCYAVATGRAEQDVTVNLKKALQPTRSKGMAYLSEKDLPEFLNELEKYDTKYRGNLSTKLSFKLMVSTFVRSSEIREAKWEEIDWEKAEWRIPAERMKMKETHIVPLSKQSMETLKEMKHISGHNKSGYVFPSQANPRKAMSENTFLKAIKNMGYKGKTTGHGFRSTASTILNENGFRSDVIERQLAHGERNQVRKAYNHAEYLSERREMMQWYADHIDALREGTEKHHDGEQASSTKPTGNQKNGRA